MQGKKAHILLITTLLIAVVSFLFLPISGIQAGALENRQLQMSSSIPSQTTTHTFSFDITTTDAVGSIEFEYCSNSPLFTESCSALNGFDISGANLTNQTGETGFSIHPDTTINSLVLSRPAQPTTPGEATYTLENVVNPNTPNTSFYVRLSTYASDDATGPRLDDGGIGVSTANRIDLQAYVPPYLRFCVGLNIFNNDCSTASGHQIDFGVLRPDTTASGISKFLAATNAPNGYNIIVDGTTMTAGNQVIPALEDPTASQLGVSQFGMNLRNNTNPDVGLEPAGPGTAQATPRYGQPNEFAFNRGDTLVNTSAPNDLVTFTASYVINISDDQPLGRYATTLTYICTGSF